MMDRNREARGPMRASVNGSGGLSRRQQRSNNLRDSPEENGAVEFHDMVGRLRDRVGKKDRDRESSGNRSKRRGERLLHGSNRDEGGETSDDSLEDDDEDDDEELGALAAPRRVPLPPSSISRSPSSIPSSLPSNQLYHHHQRNTIPPAKGIRAPPLLTAAGEIVVPRKARSGTASKRSHECWLSGSGAGGAGCGTSGGVSGSGDPTNTIHRQTSTSTNGPAVRKKMKPMSGQKHRPPKVMKSPSLVQDIEFEVAEVLFAMTRQFQPPTKQETQKSETNGSVNDSKSRVSSPSHLTTTSQSSDLPSPNLTSIPSIVAPKRKKPRVVANIEERSSTNQQHHAASSTPTKFDGEETTKMEVVSTKLDKHTTSSAVTENGSASHDVSLPPKTAITTHGQQESSKMEVVSESKLSSSQADINQRKEAVASSSSKKETHVESDENHHDDSDKKTAADFTKVEKFKFDFLGSPSSKSSPEAEASSEYSANRKPLLPDDLSKTTAIAKLEEEKAERALKMDTAESVGDVKMVEKSSLQDSESNESLVKEERALNLHINIEKTDEDLPSSSSRQQPPPHQKYQQSKLPKHEKGQPALPMSVADWPGALPPVGYMGQAPSLQAAFPLDGSNGTSKSIQLPHFPSPKLRTKRCATHCYIAQNIYYHQQITRMNPFWAAAPGGVPVFGAKPPYNLSSVPSLDSIILNPLQGGYPGRSSGSLPDKSGPVSGAGAAVVCGENLSKEKTSAVDNFPDSQKQKSHGIPQAASMHLPPFLFPMNQQQAVTATAAAARSGGVKVLGDDSSNMPPPSSNNSSSVAMTFGMNSASVPAVSFNYANLPANEAPYITILQNNGYSFPIPAHVGMVPQYRANHPQAIPYFGGPFYTSQMIHPSQLPQQALPAQPKLQTTSNSSGSTSSQKHSQQQMQHVSSAAATTGSAPHSLPHSKHRQQQLSHHHGQQLEGDAGSEESLLTADSRVSHGQTGGAYTSNFCIPLHPQDYANIMSHAAIAMGASSGNHNDKHHLVASSQNQQGNMKIDLTQSPTFPMPFAAFNGAAAAAAFDFSSLLQNPVFQSLPEATRQGYQMAAAAAQHKYSHKSEDVKLSNGDSVNSKLLGEEERKMASAGKSHEEFSQHSLSFSRADGDAATTSIISNTVIDGSRTLNQIPAAVSAGRPSSAAPLTTGAATSNASLSQINEQPHQLVQLQQLHKQQQVQMQQQLAPRSKPISNSTGIYSDLPPSGTIIARFPNTLGGHFPQAIIQGTTPNQSTHWKTSAQPAAVPSPAKNHVPQQLIRASQPTLPGDQMHISFTSNSQKFHQSGQPPSSNTSSVYNVAGSPQASSTSKTTVGSPRASLASKPFQLQQQLSTNSPSGSSQKSSPVTNRNTPSILGNPHSISSAQNLSTKQHIHQQQVPKMHSFSQPQLYFSNATAYLQAQTPQGNAAGYFQRWSSDQQQQQQPNSTSISTSMLSLCSPTPTLTGSNVASDPANLVSAAAANTMKGGGLQQVQLAVGGTQGSHPIMIAPGYPYIHTMPSMSVKPVGSSKSPGGGNENVHSCWQPEKR